MISAIALKAELSQREQELERSARLLEEKACLTREHLRRVEIAAAEARGALRQHRTAVALVLAQPEIKP